MIRVCAPGWVEIVTEGKEEAYIQVAHIGSIEALRNGKGTSIYLVTAESVYFVKEAREEVMGTCKFAQAQLP